ncbi:MAG: AraC family transcriptional regulator [Limisphaerales bacterium]
MKRTRKELSWRSQVTGDPLWPLTELFEPLEDVQFWVKDRESRYVHVNRAFLLNYALDETARIIGETDYHLSPAYLADQFWLDDERVLAGHRVVNRIELVGDADQATFWNVTNKVPFRDARGRIVGTAGTTRRLGPAGQGVAGAHGFEAVLARIRDRYREQLPNRKLAALAGLSLRGFERKFRQNFQVTPQQYLRKLRIRMACRALVFTEQPLAEVAVECGFADQSHFNHEFRRQMGRTPRAYREHYRRAVV